MRILISCTAAYGHFHPLVPFARAAIARGHEVAFATGADLVERVRAADFPVFETGLPFEEHKRILAAELAEYVRMAPAEGRAFIFPLVNALRARTNVDDLLRIAEHWRPDLIVHESAEFSAPLVAAALGVPNVNHAYGPRVPARILEDCGARLADLWSRVCAQPVRFGGLYRYLHIDICPPCLQTDSLTPPCTVQTIRPLEFDAVAGEMSPPWLPKLGPGRTVYVTLGTRLVQPTLLRTVVEAVLDFGLNVLCTTNADAAIATSLPRDERLHVERYIPHSLVFEHCDLVVCHAGAGTMLCALSHGLPLLLIPQGADQFDNADRCVEQGVAIRFLPREVRAGAIQHAVRRLFDGGYAQAAAAMRDRLLGLPSAEAALDRCEALVSGH